MVVRPLTQFLCGHVFHGRWELGSEAEVVDVMAEGVGDGAFDVLV